MSLAAFNCGYNDIFISHHPGFSHKSETYEIYDDFMILHTISMLA
jgi:hypothetical protein